MTSDACAAARRILAAGALLALLAVAAGAFAAHGLKSSLDTYRLGIFETAARYQMYHALALLAVGTLAASRGTGLRDRHTAVLRLALCPRFQRTEMARRSHTRGRPVVHYRLADSVYRCTAATEADNRSGFKRELVPPSE